MAWTGPYNAFGIDFSDTVANALPWTIDQASNAASVSVRVWANDAARLGKQREIGSHFYQWISGGMVEEKEWAGWNLV